MKKIYTFEHDFLMEKFLQEEPQTLDDMIPDGFNTWMESLDIQDVMDYAQEYAEKYGEKIINDIIRVIDVILEEYHQEDGDISLEEKLELFKNKLNNKEII